MEKNIQRMQQPQPMLITMCMCNVNKETVKHSANRAYNIRLINSVNVNARANARFAFAFTFFCICFCHKHASLDISPSAVSAEEFCCH